MPVYNIKNGEVDRVWYDVSTIEEWREKYGSDKGLDLSEAPPDSIPPIDDTPEVDIWDVVRQYRDVVAAISLIKAAGATVPRGIANYRDNLVRVAAGGRPYMMPRRPNKLDKLDEVIAPRGMV